MTDTPEDKTVTARSQAVRRHALAACVERIKPLNLKGQARDQAAAHFLAGASVVAEAAGIDGFPAMVDEAATYMDVLEALATA